MAKTPFYKTFELKLVSPHMKDGRGALKGETLVHDLQYLLNDHSKNALDNKSFGDFYNGKADGEYGMYTASAVRQAKWFLGYPSLQCNSVAGPILQDYLRGNEKLPLLNRQRRKSRLADTPLSIRIKAFNKAVTQIGIKENPPDSNRVLYSEWYGIIGAWCAMFVTWCHIQVGGKRFSRGHYYAYVPFIIDDARAGRNGLHLVTEPVKGDLVCFDWDNDHIADHVGIFETWLNKANGTFSTVEGNTSSTNNSNGGQVMRRERNRSDVQAFVRVIEP